MATTSFFTHHLRVISLTAVVGAALPVAIILAPRAGESQENLTS
jgi:hypothetical protein